MTPEDHRKVKEIVAEALERSNDERASFVASACADHPELRTRVEKLLSYNTHATSFLARSPLEDLTPLQVTEALSPDAAPQRIGKYRVVSRIGSGGSGTVFEAEQEHPQRTVALKLLSSGDLSDTMLKRFERESQVLAHLHHPGIAHVYEAGIHEGEAVRMPFIAMELVRDGRTIISYADEHKLSIKDRLELFIKACKAVQHAHERGIVHRDLKPANILVDVTGQPRVIDFGVAHIVSGDEHHEVTQHTSAGDIIGTLPYMSPEQCAATPDAIDARTDAYALGVVLFELLAGRLPLILAGMSMEEAIRSIRTRPSARLSRVKPDLARDLDAITANALEKDPARRYHTVAALAADVRRFLDRRPVLARPPSLLHITRLFAQRHRVPVFIGSVAALLLLASSIVSTVFALREDRAADAEAHQRLVAERISKYLTGMMDVPNPHTGGEKTTVLEMLDGLVAQLDEKQDEIPIVEATVRTTAGNTYLNLNRVREAQAQFRRALTLHEEIDGYGKEYAALCNSLGMTHQTLGESDLAEPYYRRAIEVTRELPEVESQSIVSYLANLGSMLASQGRVEEALPLLLESHEAGLQIYENDPLYLVASYRRLGVMYKEVGQYEEAEKLSAQAVEVARDHLDPSAPSLPAAISALGNVKQLQGDLPGARECFEESWSITSGARSVGSPDWIVSFHNLFQIYVKMDDRKTAERFYLDGLAKLEAAKGPDDMRVREGYGRMASLYEEWGRGEVAARLRAEHLGWEESTTQPEPETQPETTSQPAP